MHETLAGIQQQLEKLIVKVGSVIPNDEPFGNAHSNWSFPGLTRAELIEEAQSLLNFIEERGGDDLEDDHVERLQDYVRRLQHLQTQTAGQLWGNAATAVPAYLFTLNGLRKALESAITRDAHAEEIARLRKLKARLRSFEAQINKLDPRTASLAAMVERIEKAYNAAEQLPTDLESLSEARQEIAELAKEATKDQTRLSDILTQADEFEKKLKNSANEAEAVLMKCETAYSAATSVGLAAAFNERSVALSRSMWTWVGGLVLALIAGSVFGINQLEVLSELIKIPDASTSAILLNLFLSLLSIGAPVWFAWLATKQIGQRFRLAEDYAFKASISRAYEGFRREAARFDKDMEAKLLTSALTRLDELPLRLVEADSYGSPWHELASSDIVKQAMKAVPGFAEQVKNLAGGAISAVKPAKAKPAPQAPLAAVED